MNTLNYIGRWFTMMLCLIGSGCLLFWAYVGFSLAKAFNAQWWFVNWSQDAVATLLAILLLVVFYGLLFRRTWARWAGGLGFGALLVWVAYEVVAFGYVWMHSVIGVSAALALTWICAPASGAKLHAARSV